MRGRHVPIGLLAAACATTVALSGHAEQHRSGTSDVSASLAPAPPVVPRIADQPSTAADVSPVRKQATGKGFIFHPSTTDLYAFRFAIGAFYDAIDPAVMYGFNLRVPQLTLDARYGLGEGWSLKGHFNSMLVTTELLLGAGYAWTMGDWSLEFLASVGVYYGVLGAVGPTNTPRMGFEAMLISPEYRPELTLGYVFGDIALSLRATLLLMGPERTRVGEVWAGLDNSNAFAGHSEMLYVENTTRSNSIWYFGIGAMTTRSYYALWLMFPDTPGLFTYPRIVAGYEF
jgi:hypothetical protein